MSGELEKAVRAETIRAAGLMNENVLMYVELQKKYDELKRLVGEYLSYTGVCEKFHEGTDTCIYCALTRAVSDEQKKETKV